MQKAVVSGEIGRERTSGAKARNGSIGIMRGLKPPPPSVKAKARAAKKTNAKTRTKASAVKANAAAAKKTNAKSKKVSTTVNAKNKKHAAGKRVALNVSRQKTASTNRPASSAEPGQ